MNWKNLLGQFGKNLLSAMGESPSWLSDQYNPITRALKQGDFAERYSDLKGFNKSAVSRVASICQMAVYDATGGPDGDDKQKGLRRQWYSWYKVSLAQPFSRQLAEAGDKKEMIGFDGTGWAGRLSTTYADLVNTGAVTYRDLWVNDASRMMDVNWNVLFSDCHILIAVEKDSLYADFEAAGAALGAQSRISGKGKNSKAATEKDLREHFGWLPSHDPFTSENPLIILTISDHDFDGEAVIGPTFGQQARRYTPHVREARVGIRPENVDMGKWQDKWYEVKVNNSGYVNWAEKEALFTAECSFCGHRWLQQGTRGKCTECGNEIVLTVKLDGQVLDQPHGFEVEALPTRAYYGLLVDALLNVLPFDYIVSKLRDECIASDYDAACTIRDGILKVNKSYQALLEEFDRLEQIKAAFEQEIEDDLIEIAAPHTEDFRDDDDDPTKADFRQHLESTNGWAEVWRPFSQSDRTTKLVKLLLDIADFQIADFAQEELDWC